MSALDDAPVVELSDRAAWRAWLEANHAVASGAWLVTFRRGHGPVLEYADAVEEALCFGWIDGQGGVLDERRRRQYFAPRRPRSGWASSNKARVERLIAEGRMTPAGLAAIERAKANGSWSALDEIERGVVPDDLTAALAADGGAAAARFGDLAPSTRRMLVGWVVQAKRPETRAGRIAEIATTLGRGELPGPMREQQRRAAQVRPA